MDDMSDFSSSSSLGSFALIHTDFLLMSCLDCLLHMCL